MSSTLRYTHRRLGTIAAALALVVLTGCSTEPDDPGNSGGGCRDYVITYSAVGTGDGQFDFLFYDNGLGQLITVVPVGRTFSRQIQMCAGDTVALEVQGAVGGGTLVISVTGEDGEGNQVTLSEEAIGDGTVTTYTLTIAQHTLP